MRAGPQYFAYSLSDGQGNYLAAAYCPEDSRRDICRDPKVKPLSNPVSLAETMAIAGALEAAINAEMGSC
jgi:hypothetical protein